MQKPALHQTLFILVLGSRVYSYSTTDTESHHTRFNINHHRANRDIENAITVRLQEANRACINAARKTFQLTNDLHRANLGRARDRSARKQRAHQVDKARSIT